MANAPSRAASRASRRRPAQSSPCCRLRTPPANFTKIVQRLPVRIAVPAEVAREGILRPGLSVEVDVHTRDETLPAPTLAGAVAPIVDAVSRRLRDAAVSVGFGRAEAATQRTAGR